MKKPSELEIQEERDSRMRSQYFDPIENFPDRIDQLLEKLNRVCYRRGKKDSLYIFLFIIDLHRSNGRPKKTAKSWSIDI